MNIFFSIFLLDILIDMSGISKVYLIHFFTQNSVYYNSKAIHDIPIISMKIAKAHTPNTFNFKFTTYFFSKS